MIWVDFAKSFLAAIAANDKDFVKECLSDNFICVWDERSYTRRRFFDIFVLSEDINKIEIQSAAYADKTIFFECKANDIGGCVLIVEIDSNGKIKKLKIYGG